MSNTTAKLIAWMVSIFIICFYFSIISAFAGGVTDDNNGTKGDILVSAGSNSGKGSIGHWTDPTAVPELKGAKGDKGDVGTNGKDVDPTTLNNLLNSNTVQSQQLSDLDNKVDALERTQYVIEPEVRIYDSKRLTVSPFIRYNIARQKVDVVGIRFTIKFGKSYEEAKLEKLEDQNRNLQERLLALEQKVSNGKN